MKKESLGSKQLIAKLIDTVEKVRPYSFVLFLVFVISIYGVVVYKINTFMNAQPSEDAIVKQVKAAQVPFFDQGVIKQLKSLQDNSVSVQALFEETRNNPFDQK